METQIKTSGVREQPSRTATGSASPTGPQSITDPADLLALLGRFAAGTFLFLMTMALLLNKRYDVAILTGGASLLLQLATHRMWRRLRNERLAKLAEPGAVTMDSAEATEAP